MRIGETWICIKSCNIIIGHVDIDVQVHEFKETDRVLIRGIRHEDKESYVTLDSLENEDDMNMVIPVYLFTIFFQKVYE